MLTTRFVDGAPCWIDVTAPDPEGAASFYRALFGWSYRPAGPEGGGYGFLERAGRIVAGCAHRRRPGPGRLDRVLPHLRRRRHR